MKDAVLYFFASTIPPFMSAHIRNIAIIAHVDHGKTTLVDQLLRQSGTFRDNQYIVERVMDSNVLEREKGITIMAKNTAIKWNDYKINIVDTPGHADFGGEVERILKMVNGVILLVDAAEGPLPQTKFVLRKSLALGYRPIVVINKIDRKDARPDEVLNEVFDLFVDLHATDEQLDFPVLYAIGKQGIATTSLQERGTDLRPLFELIVKHVPPPASDTEKPFKMLISSVEWNDYLGRIAIGRVEQGVIRQNMDIELISREGDRKGSSRATKLFTFLGLKREPVEMAYAGDIIALAGYENVDIGDTICTTEDLNPIEYTNIDRPTLSMFFRVNDGPMVGREGKFVTSNHLKDRLQKEARNNISIRVEETADADVIKVSGRGELQLAILIETMRREGFEFCVSRPEVVLWEKDGIKYEPVEEVVVDVPSDYASKVIDKLQQRKGILESMDQEGENTRLTFKVPSRGLLGFRSEVLTETRGTAMVHQQFHSYEPFKGEIAGRNRGAMIALEDGPVTAYALESLQDRGIFFVEPGDVSYKGMIVGQHSRAGDLIVNVAKAKHLTNHRASQTGAEVKIAVAKKLTLEQAIEFLEKDELLEVTPQSLRLRKRWLDHNERKRMEKQ
jgi:GTP-binding protein